MLIKNRTLFFIMSTILIAGGGHLLKTNPMVGTLLIITGIYFGCVAMRPNIHFGDKPPNPKKTFKGDLFVKLKED